MFHVCVSKPYYSTCRLLQVETFATDNKLFLQEFVKVYHRVIHKSPFKLFPIVEDTRQKPRWERPGTLPTFPPTTTTTTTTTTTPKPIVRGTALQPTGERCYVYLLVECCVSERKSDKMEVDY